MKNARNKFNRNIKKEPIEYKLTQEQTTAIKNYIAIVAPEVGEYAEKSEWNKIVDFWFESGKKADEQIWQGNVLQLDKKGVDSKIE